MTLRLVQAIFLIIGTAVGVGILALPISTSDGGFLSSSLGLVITWFFIVITAINIIKARVIFSEDIDLGTMTKTLIGPRAHLVTEIGYLAVLMALVCVYITVGSAWTVKLSERFLNIQLTQLHAQIGFTLVIASIIFSGLANLANINQLITSAKLFCLVMIMILCFQDVSYTHLAKTNFEAIPGSFSILLTTFGFSVILPSLATFLGNDKKQLFNAVIIGSTLILAVYVCWEFVVIGVVGTDQLKAIADAKDKGTEVVHHLSQLAQSPSIESFGFGIVITAVLTSFLGVGHCLFHYLKDVIPIPNYKTRSYVAIVAGFSTPVLIIHLFPAGITSILSVAGIFLAIIQGILPNAMVLTKAFEARAKPLSRFSRLCTYASLAFFTMVIVIELIRFVK